jgi:hypothetical protein
MDRPAPLSPTVPASRALSPNPAAAQSHGLPPALTLAWRRPLCALSLLPAICCALQQPSASHLLGAAPSCLQIQCFADRVNSILRGVCGSRVCNNLQLQLKLHPPPIPHLERHGWPESCLSPTIKPPGIG